jgi:uncharacterized DUF497 family protein
MYYMPNLRHLVWDEWNIPHIARHGVTQQEVEEACHADVVIYRETYKNRLLLVGSTQAGRVLAIVLGPVPNRPDGIYYPFTARPAHRSERRDYEQLKGEAQT